MRAESNSEWDELATLWKRESASMSLDDLHRHARRVRLKLLAVAISQLLACAIGIGNALWLALFTPMRYVGWGTGAGIAIFAVLALRCHWRAHPAIGEDALKTLDADLSREEQMLEVLAAGRVVILAALAAVVIAASNQLRHYQDGGLSMLLPFLASTLYLIVVSLLGALLSRRARQRAAVFRHTREALKSCTEAETGLLAGSRIK